MILFYQQKIGKWAYQWKMEFNPDSTRQATEVLFSCECSKPDHSPLVFNGQLNKQTLLSYQLPPSLV